MINQHEILQPESKEVRKCNSAPLLATCTWLDYLATFCSRILDTVARYPYTGYQENSGNIFSNYILRANCWQIPSSGVTSDGFQ